MEGWSLVAGSVARSLFEVSGSAPCWVRMPLVRGEGVAYRPRIGGPEDAAALMMELLANEPRESFLTVCLDAKHRVNAVHHASIGGLDYCPAGPREVFQAALLANAPQ